MELNFLIMNILKKYLLHFIAYPAILNELIPGNFDGIQNYTIFCSRNSFYEWGVYFVNQTKKIMICNYL